MLINIFGYRLSFFKKEKPLDTLRKEVEDIIKNNETHFFLYLDSYDIEEIPEIVFSAKHIESLDIDFKSKILIPSNITSLNKLKKLRLSSYSNKSPKIVIHDDFKQLESLKEISLNIKSLNKIPEKLFTPKNLEQVAIWSSAIEDLPSSLFLLPNIQQIFIYDSKLTYIPTEIRLLNNLEHFSIQNSKIEVLPDEIGELEKLKSLSLGGNLIKIIPKSIRNLTNLQSLDLSENKLTSIPKEALYSSKLRNFTIQDNPLTEMPEILDIGIFELKKYFKLSTNFRLDVPVNLITAIQQYLLFFREYVSEAKGIDIDYDVVRNKEYLEITIDFDKNIDEPTFIEYLEEYISFAKSNSVSMINVVGSPTTHEIDLLRMNLEVQINNLNTQLKFKNWQLNYLEEELSKNRDERIIIFDKLYKSVALGNPQPPQVNEKLIKLVETNKIDKVFEELLLIPNLPNKDEVILLSNRWRNLQRSKSMGQIGFDEFERIMNQISASLLILIRNTSSAEI